MSPAAEKHLLKHHGQRGPAEIVGRSAEWGLPKADVVAGAATGGRLAIADAAPV